jgi:hypothetical protein
MDRRGCAAIGADLVTRNVVGYGDCMEEFRGIAIRRGHTGCRAALVGGPDIWELISTFKSGKARGAEAITATAELLNLTDSQVRTAARYYGAFPAEINRLIALNTADADGVEAAWQRGQAALT